MEIIEKSLDELTPYENNPRHNEAAVKAVKASIGEVGYISPIIVDEDGIILAGHTRYRALLELGVDKAPVGVQRGLTEDQKRKYRLLDNKVNELAQWDVDKLRGEAEGLDFSFDFGLADLYAKQDNIQEAAKKEKDKERQKSMSKLCTCPRCGRQWEV